MTDYCQCEQPMIKCGGTGIRCTICGNLARFPEMTTAEIDAQRQSWVRGMTTPCEHGELDFEQCPDCRGAPAMTDEIKELVRILRDRAKEGFAFDLDLDKAADALERLAKETATAEQVASYKTLLASYEALLTQSEINRAEALEARLQEAEHRIGFLEYQGRCREEMLVEKEARLQEAVGEITQTAPA